MGAPRGCLEGWNPPSTQSRWRRLTEAGVHQCTCFPMGKALKSFLSFISFFQSLCSSKSAKLCFIQTLVGYWFPIKVCVCGVGGGEGRECQSPGWLSLEEIEVNFWANWTVHWTVNWKVWHVGMRADCFGKGDGMGVGKVRYWVHSEVPGAQRSPAATTLSGAPLWPSTWSSETFLELSIFYVFISGVRKSSLNP